MRYTDENSRDLKKTLTDLAESRSKPHLLELTGLLSASEGKISEAIDLLDHAESLYVLDLDKVRSLLYLADLHRRDGHPDQAKKIIQRLLADPVYQKIPAAQAARSLLQQM
jgi:adenylylsulfate kinase-like enzyme